MVKCKLSKNVEFKMVSIESMEDLHLLLKKTKKDLATKDMGSVNRFYFLDMSVHSCEQYKEILLTFKSLSVPLFLVVNNHIQSNVAIDMIKLFTGIVYKREIEMQRKVIEFAVKNGYPFLSPSITLNINTSVASAKEKNTKIERLILASDMVQYFDDQEVTILNALLDGKTGYEVAGEMFIAQSTLSTRMSRLFQRFNVESRTALISKLIKDNYVLTVRKSDTISV